jgi:hypothetical protein
MKKVIRIIVVGLFVLLMLYTLGNMLGGGLWIGILAIPAFFATMFIYSAITRLLGKERSVEENARLGKILKKLWSIGHHLGVKDGEAESDKRHYTSDQLDQIELWVDLIQKKLEGKPSRRF